MMNSYVRFTIQMTGSAGVANSAFLFKGAAQCAAMAIQSIQTYVNSVQVDNQQNAWSIYDNLLTHSTSNDWLQHDATLMLGAGTVYQQAAAGSTSSAAYTFALPLLGLLGSQQSLPLYLLNGTLQIQINWQPAVASVYQSGATIVPLNAPLTYAGGAGSTLAQVGVALIEPGWTGFSITNVQCVYDKVTPESAFVDKVRHDMMSGAKYVFSYTNYATTSVNTSSAGQYNLNYGLNVSSLRGVVMTQYNTANLSGVGVAAGAGSISNGMNQFQIALDGRLISSLALNSQTDASLVFAELQKTFGRIYDASITDPVINFSTQAIVAFGANYSGGTFLTQLFAAGASAQRVNEGLAFQGSPCSILNAMFTVAAAGTVAFQATTCFFLLIADFQLLIDSTGSVEIVR